MTSRERVRAVLAGGIPDRIPNGLGATLNSGIHVLACHRLRRLLDLPDRPARIMSFEANALFDPDLLAALGVDMVSLGVKLNPARFWTPGWEADWKPVTLWGAPCLLPRAWDLATDPDGTVWMDGLAWDTTNFNVPLPHPGCRLKCPPSGRHFDPVPNALNPPVADPSPDDYHPPRDFPDEWLRQLEDSARWLSENTDLAVVCDETIVDLQVAPGGAESWWMRMATEPGTVREFLDKACEAGLAQIRLLDQAVGRYADLMMIAHDFGDRRGVQVGPDPWRAVYLPHYRRLFAGWKERTRMRIGLHSCGSIVDILDDLVDAGLQVLNPVQVSARGMEPAELKRRFGKRLVFYGGSYDAVQCPPGTPDEVVRERVERNIRDLAAGGGYLFAGVHNIQHDTPAGHLRATLDALRACRYP